MKFYRGYKKGQIDALTGRIRYDLVNRRDDGKRDHQGTIYEQPCYRNN